METSVIMPQTTTPLPPEVLEDLEEMGRKDQQIKNLATDPGWLKVKDEFQRIIEQYESIQSIAVESKDSSEDVKFKVLVNQEVARVLRGVLAGVADHAEEQ